MSTADEIDGKRTRAGLRALQQLSIQTQVVFLNHRAHFERILQEALGEDINVCLLAR